MVSKDGESPMKSFQDEMKAELVKAISGALSAVQHDHQHPPAVD